MSLLLQPLFYQKGIYEKTDNTIPSINLRQSTKKNTNTNTKKKTKFKILVLFYSIFFYFLKHKNTKNSKLREEIEKISTS